MVNSGNSSPTKRTRNKSPSNTSGGSFLSSPRPMVHDLRSPPETLRNPEDFKTPARRIGKLHPRRIGKLHLHSLYNELVRTNQHFYIGSVRSVATTKQTPEVVSSDDEDYFVEGSEYYPLANVNVENVGRHNPNTMSDPVTNANGKRMLQVAMDLRNTTPGKPVSEATGVVAGKKRHPVYNCKCVKRQRNHVGEPLRSRRGKVMYSGPTKGMIYYVCGRKSPKDRCNHKVLVTKHPQDFADLAAQV